MVWSVGVLLFLSLFQIIFQKSAVRSFTISFSDIRFCVVYYLKLQPLSFLCTFSLCVLFFLVIT